MQKATTLVDAIHRFSPQPIKFGVDSTNESFYVERHDDPLGELRVQLISSPTAVDKTLLAGHRGSGKSTELNALAADPKVQSLYEVVGFSVKDSLELGDVDHVDLLFTLVSRTYESLSAQGPLPLERETVEALEGWRSRVVERMEEVAKGASADLAVEGDAKGLGACSAPPRSGDQGLGRGRPRRARSRVHRACARSHRGRGLACPGDRSERRIRSHEEAQQ